MAQSQDSRTTCEGRVLNTAGEPVADARVTLYQMIDGEWAQSGTAKRLDQRDTGPDGTFAFTVGQFPKGPITLYVVVERAGSVVNWLNWWTEEDWKGDLTAGESKDLSGLIVDEEGQPVAEAQVSVHDAIIGRPEGSWDLLNGEIPVFPKVHTDAEGRFTFSNVPADATFALRVSKPGRATLCTRNSPPSAGRCPFSPGQADIKIILPVEARIEGVVVDRAGGQPVGGVGILFFPVKSASPGADAPAVSASDGSFRFDGLMPGSYSLHLATYTQAMPEWVAEPVDVNLVAGQAVEGIKLELTQGGIIEALVKDSESGEPIQGADVNIDCLRYGESLSGKTDETGVARFRVLPGEYGVFVFPGEEYASDAFDGRISVQQDETERVEWAITPKSKIAGIVRDLESKPLAGVKIGILSTEFYFEGDEVVTDANGAFDVSWDSAWLDEDMPSTLLVAKDSEHDLALATPIDAQTRTLDLKLEPGVTLVGRVAWRDRQPLRDAELFVLVGEFDSPYDAGPQWEGTIDAAGSFEIRTLPARPVYQICACADGYGRIFVPVDGRRIKDHRLDAGEIALLPADQSVSGIVVDPNGKPVAGARVSCNGQNLPKRFDTDGGFSTDSEGRFVIDGVCAERFSLFVFAPRPSRLYALVETEGGAADLRIVVSKAGEYGQFFPKCSPSLVSKPLPEMKDVGIELPADANDRMVLVCLWDLNQRPSRRCVSELSTRAAALAEKGVTIVAIQAGKVEPEAFEEWKRTSQVPFAVGCVADDAAESQFNWGVTSLPHLILTDRKHIVVAEGFELLEELDKRIEEASGR